jgi:hypothetical protein
MNPRAPHGDRRLYLAGGILVAALAALAIGAFPLGSRAFFVALAFAVGAYVAALRLAVASPAAPRRVVLISLGIALAMRVPLAVAPVGPQSDMFRYLWDARLQRAHLNPYDVVPSDPAVAHLHTADTRTLNNSSVPSPYPPAAQLFFRLATSAGESVYAVKAALIVCDALVGLLLWRWLVWQRRNPLLVIVYAWNPLVAMEVASGGHLDVAGALLVVATAVAISRGYRAAAAATFAASVAMKFLPIVLAPLLWKRLRVRDAAVGAAVLLALYAPYVSGPRVPLGSIRDVIDRFRFNAPVFDFLEHHLGAHAAVGVAVVVGLAVAALPPVRRRVTDPGAWAWPMAAALVCSPIVYPWYLVWLAPFLVTRGTAPLLVWTLSILPVYVVWELGRRGGQWAVPSAVLAIEYGLVAIAAASLLWMRKGARRAGRRPVPAPARAALKSMRVSVVVPTHNEREAIGRVLRDIPTALAPEVIVVDSDSTDGTPEIAAALGARVVREPRRGYGRACLTGIEAASAPDVVVFLDGDYSDRPAELPDVLAPIQEGRADIVIGSRLAGRLQPGAMPRHAVWGNRLAAWLIRRLYGVPVTDLGPFRAARADALRALDLRETTYGWAVEIIVRGALRGYRLVEVPVSYYPRIGRSKISGTLRGALGAGYGILSSILKSRLRPGRPAD